MSNFTLTCPLPGPPPPISDECETTKTVTWTSPGVYEARFFVENLILRLVRFQFTPISNNGSTITVGVKYGINGVREIKKTFTLGTLPSVTSKYVFINFGNFTSGNNVIQLVVNVVGGSSGSFQVLLDCEVNIASKDFCYIPANQNPQDLCLTCPTVYTVFYDADYSPQGFPRGEIFLDPEFSTEAPIGFYKVYKAQGKPVIYYYDGNALVKQDVCTNIVDCGPSGTNLTHTRSQYTLIQKIEDPDAPAIPPSALLWLAPTGIGLIVGELFNLFVPKKKTLKYSEKTLVIWYPTLDPGYSYIKVEISGGSYEDFYITLSDANAVSPSIGVLSFSAYNTNELFSIVQPGNRFYPKEGTNKIEGNLLINGDVNAQTQAIIISVYVGQKSKYKSNVTITTNVIANCQIPYYRYLMDVHPYSAFDSFYQPKCDTYMYSLQPINQWVKNTKLFNDYLLVSPAYPYNYYYENKIYQVGTPIFREFGVITNYRVKSSGFLNFQKWLGLRETAQIIEPIVDGPRDHSSDSVDAIRVESCVNVSFIVGRISKIYDTQSTFIPRPNIYVYFLGFSATEIDSEANAPFNYYNYLKLQHQSIGGFAHAVYRLSGSFKTLPGQIEYLPDWSPGAVKEFLTGAGYAGWFLTAISIAVWAANNFGIGCDSALSTFGLCTVAIFVAVLAIAALINFFVPTTRVIIENCKTFIMAFAIKPYLEVGDTIYFLISTFSTPWTYVIKDGLYTDGVYFYTQVSGVITVKEPNRFLNSFDNDKLTYALPPDNPTTITAVSSKFFLAYCAGRPWKYNLQTASDSLNSESIPNFLGELVQPNTLSYSVPEGYITSFTSKEDANEQVNEFLEYYSAITKYNLSSFTEVPGLDTEVLNFTHEIKIENYPTKVNVFYNNSDELGVQVGKKLFYETQGVCFVLNGFYAGSGSGGNYLNFYELIDGQVVDIWVMSTSGSTQVTSQETSQVENISTTNLEYTSSWYFYSTDAGGLVEWNSHPLFTQNDTWGSANFYSNTVVRRGFINTPLTYDIFYLYDSNTVLTTFAEAPTGYYAEVPIYSNQEPFGYISGTTETFTLDIVQECSDDIEFNGIRITCYNEDGDQTPTMNGIRFNLYLYRNANVGGFNQYETYSLQILAEDSELFFELDSSYIGTIYHAEIGGFLSENPINKIYYSGGTFTPCNTPTPTPSPQTWTVTPTASNTPTPTLTPSNTPTPTITPTSGGIMCDDYYNQTNSNLTGINYTDCNGIAYTNVTVSVGQNICVEQGTLNGGDSGFLTNFGSCGTYYPGSTPSQTPTNTPTNTTTPSATPTLSSISLSTPQSNDCTACALTSYSTTGYVSPSDTEPTVGDIVYSNSSGTTFNGSSQWWKTTWGNPISQYSIKISNVGVVQEVSNCATCPSPTPTNTVTPTNTPTNTITPSNTPTITPTPSTDVYFYYNTDTYNCGINGGSCTDPSIGTAVLRFSTSQVSTWFSNGITAYSRTGDATGPSYDVDGDFLATGASCVAACTA